MNSTISHLCHVCGFSRKYNLERHINLVHGEDNEAEESKEEIEVDDSDREDELSEAGFSSEEIEDAPTYWEWYQQALRDTQERRDKKYEKYINI